MLDQNTDRMWYVIGAVLIGGLIIASSVMLFSDTVFAGIGESFDSYLGLIKNERVLVGSWDTELEGGFTLSPSGAVSEGWRDEFARHADLTPILEKQGLDQTYELVFDLKSKDTSKNNKITTYAQNGRGYKYTFGYHSLVVTEEYQTYTVSDLSFEKSKYSDEATHLAFYGSYGTGNVPVVKNVRLYLIKDGD